jgi:nucleoid DNA-binding protein
MNQSELIEKVARATELNPRLAGQAVKAVVAVILDSLAAGEAVRVSGLGTSMWRHGRHAMGAIHEAERPSRSQPAKQCGFTPAKPSRMFSIRRTVLLAKNPLRQRDPRCGSKAAAAVAGNPAKLCRIAMAGGHPSHFA